MKTPILETDRLILRPISIDDVEDIEKYFNEWEIVKYTRASWPLEKGSTLKRMKDITLPAIEAGEQISWAITLKETGAFIGRIDYRFYKDKDPDRGFFIGTPFQKQGFMTEAVIATQDFMFLEYGLKQFTVSNAESNYASKRIKEKTGAQFIETRNDPQCHIGDKEEIWKVTKESWIKARKKL